MSFFGKKYKKVKTENTDKLMEILKPGDKVKALISHPDALTSFTKNADGSIQYVVEVNGTKGIDERFFLGQEAEYTSPDGFTSKNLFELDGNVLKSSMTRGSGGKIHSTRTFDGNKMVMKITADGVDIVGTVWYESV